MENNQNYSEQQTQSYYSGGSNNENGFGNAMPSADSDSLNNNRSAYYSRQPQAGYGQPSGQPNYYNNGTYSSQNYAPMGNPQNPYAQRNPEEVSVWQYLGMMWIMSIPIVGLVVMCIWAFSNNSGINRSNFAKAILLNLVISVIIGTLIGIISWGVIMSILIQIIDVTNQNRHYYN